MLSPLNTLVLLAAALSTGTTTSAWKIPTFFRPGGHADGNYVGYYNKTGHAVIQQLRTKDFYYEMRGDIYVHEVEPSGHTLPNVWPVSAADNEMRLRGEPNWAVHCLCEERLPHGATDDAANSVREVCGFGCDPVDGMAIWSIRGDVVAFVCGGGRTSYHQMTLAYQKITRACGSYVAGSAYGEGAFFGPVIGYMKWTPGMDICDTALDSPHHSC